MSIWLMSISVPKLKPVAYIIPLSSNSSYLTSKLSWPWNLIYLDYGSLKVIVNGTIRKLVCGFIFAFRNNYGTMDLSCIVSSIKGDIGRKYLFLHTYLHSTSPLGVHVGKTRTVWLPDGERSLNICLLVSTQYTYTWQTPRETDGRTHTARWHRPAG